MFAKFNSSKNGVKINKIAKNQGNLSIFNVDEEKSFPKFCLQISEVNFKSKSLKISEASKKLSKLYLSVNNKFKWVQCYYKSLKETNNTVYLTLNYFQNLLQIEI